MESWLVSTNASLQIGVPKKGESTYFEKPYLSICFSGCLQYGIVAHTPTTIPCNSSVVLMRGMGFIKK